MGLLLEKSYPLALGGVVAVTAYLFMPPPVEGMKEVVQSVVNTSAIAVGFLATSLSIIYSIGKSRIMADLKKLNLTGNIVNYFIESIAAWFLLALVGGLLLLVDYKQSDQIPQWGRVAIIVMWGILAWSVASLFRIVWILRSILIAQ